MSKGEHYTIKHWSTATAEANYKNKPPSQITVNDRAATRQAIINRVRQNGLEFVERSHWGAHKNRPDKMENDWNYHSVAIHHAGRSFGCGQASSQMQDIQDNHMDRLDADDIAYHYAIDCTGNIYEGRDVGFKGGHLKKRNTGVIGIVILENLTEPDEGGDGVAKVRTLLNSLGFNQQPNTPTVQKQSAEKFIKVLREFFKISVLGGHREFPNQTGDGKICPGRVGLAMVKQLRTTLALSAPSAR